MVSDSNMTSLTSVLEANVTLEQIASAFNLSISNTTNETIGAVTPEKLFSLYDAYKLKEKEQILLYKSVAYVLGPLIILSNLIVVISSGLILKKGQQPKSTYLLLGNVSLADTIIGFSLIFGTAIDNTVTTNILCTLQIGMIVCPTMVSIFSVGFIAIDRYIYIIHGLYYKRWINTTRVRIGIVIIWTIGLILGFVPITGWINQELIHTRCVYMSLFPGEIILLNSAISLIPIVLVTVLYSMILVRAIKNVTKIRASEKPVKDGEEPKLRIYRGNINNKLHNDCFLKHPDKNNAASLKRSASLSVLKKIGKESLSVKSKSSDELNSNVIVTSYKKNDSNLGDKKLDEQSKSTLSVWTVDSEFNTDSTGNVSSSTGNISGSKCRWLSQRTKIKKIKEPRKIRAVTVVMLTSGSFMVTWLPFFIVVVFFVFCVDKIHNDKCLNLRGYLEGPLAALAFINSLLNPLIYAWWHRGFTNAVKTYVNKYFLRNVIK